MRSAILEVRHCDHFGTEGFALKNTPVFGAFSSVVWGMGAAHDILEHITGPEYLGRIDHEFVALGACMVVRGQPGLYYDLMNLAVYYHQGASLHRFEHDGKIDGEIKRIIDRARAHLWECEMEYLDLFETEAHMHAWLDKMPFWETAASNMQYGMEQAHELYRARDPNHEFSIIQEAVDSVGDYFVGQEYLLRWDDVSATIDEVEVEYDDDGYVLVFDEIS